MKHEKLTYDIRKLVGLGFRVKDKKIIDEIIKKKLGQSSLEFIKRYKLNVSSNRLNSWLSLKYSTPLDMSIKLLGHKKVNSFCKRVLFSGKSSSYCSAIIPSKPDIYLMYVIGATIGDGSLKHKEGESYSIVFEMADREIISGIQSVFDSVFRLKSKLRKVLRTDGRKTYVLKYSNKIVYYFLQKFFDLTPNKSKTVGLVGITDLKRIQKLALLLGIYHTDGSQTNREIRFYTSSKRLKSDLKKLLGKLGYRTKEYEYLRKGYSPEYHIRVVESEDLAHELELIENRILLLRN